MRLSRLLFVILGGFFLGVSQTGLLTAWSFSFTTIPLFPALIALTFVLRVRPLFFWLLLIGVLIYDWYSGEFFGSATLTYLLLIYLGGRLSSDLFTHRSLLGCAVVAFLVGWFWIFLITGINWCGLWLLQTSNPFLWRQTLLLALLEAVSTTVLTCLFYILALRWFKRPLALGG